jgi:hypothetical protein
VCSKHTTTMREAMGGQRRAERRLRGGRGGQPELGLEMSDDPAHAAFPELSTTRTETRGEGLSGSHALPMHAPVAAQ